MAHLPPFSEIKTAKKTLRKQAILWRNALSIDSLSREICVVLEAWPVFQQAEQVLSYFPHRQEIDLRPLSLAHPEKAWFLPTVKPSEPSTAAPPTMIFRQYLPDKPLPLNQFGIREPDASAPAWGGAASTLILVPGLLFDRQGYRLGYGKGYYDRFLSAQAGHLGAVGVVPNALIHENIPHEPWDVPLDLLATETGLIQSRPSPG
jgi:5-formyltetrahydrofolate cyclo-ligase